MGGWGHRTRPLGPAVAAGFAAYKAMVGGLSELTPLQKSERAFAGEGTPSSDAMEAMLGPTLMTGGGEVPTSEALAGKSTVALYFSAHWCPPCRGFTPTLARLYSDVYKAKGMEVIFVSSDGDEDAFADYFGEQPWLALPFSDRKRKDDLSQKFEVGGIPSLVILSPDGEVITKDGRAKVDRPEQYPWTAGSRQDVRDAPRLAAATGRWRGAKRQTTWDHNILILVARARVRRRKTSGTRTKTSKVRPSPLVRFCLPCLPHVCVELRKKWVSRDASPSGQSGTFLAPSTARPSVCPGVAGKT